MNQLTALADNISGRPTTLTETIGKAEMWLIRTYWDLEFPRPTLPNVDFVGGLHCKAAKPLPKEMEDFVQTSGEHGIVVFSLGSMVRNVSEDKAKEIAWALAQIPQKVLWRFEGKTPDTLGPNTRVYKWLPQNDLLGHPKTKAFVTHGGANGIYEAIHFGIPMIGIPLFGEQHDNIASIVAKGAAVSLDFRTMTRADLLSALEAVIDNPFYKKNAMWLSTIHHDQPMKPLDRVIFWIEFVMRHKGAKHLRPLAHNLTWYQYHSLDVIGFLLACVAAIAFLSIKSFLFIYRKFIKTGKKMKIKSTNSDRKGHTVNRRTLILQDACEVDVCSAAPADDLLLQIWELWEGVGHPKTRVFVTHGGANGIYESIHHGVPMVGIPLFAEQYDNIAHMVAKGAAASVDFHTMTSSDLLNALKEVINNPSYKKNVKWLSTIHHDQPMKPLDRAVFWVEYVMRHKGAKHLKPLAFNLTWYQYYSLDVIGFLLACVSAMIFLTIKCCLFVYRFFVKKQKNKKE
ncbi:hypothetical protein ACRRTK_014948 [Alexandromys fortis]